MKRTLIMLLMALMLGCCFVSCDNKTPDDKTATEDPSTPSEDDKVESGDNAKEDGAQNGNEDITLDEEE